MGTNIRTGDVERKGGTDTQETGSVSLVVPGENGKTASADCRDLLTPEEADSLRAFLISHRDGGKSSAFHTSIVGTGDEEDKFEDVVETSDMTGIGMRLAEALKQSEDDGSTLAVCFDSLTDLLRYNDEKPSYVFMHLMAGRLRNAGAVGHVHLDPDVVGDRTVRRFERLFDGTVRSE